MLGPIAAQGESVSRFAHSWQACTALGRHLVQLQIDPGDQLREACEWNNQGALLVEIDKGIDGWPHSEYALLSSPMAADVDGRWGSNGDMEVVLIAEDHAWTWQQGSIRAEFGSKQLIPGLEHGQSYRVQVRAYDADGFDVSGTNVWQKRLPTAPGTRQRERLDLSNLAPGVYLLLFEARLPDGHTEHVTRKIAVRPSIVNRQSAHPPWPGLRIDQVRWAFSSKNL